MCENLVEAYKFLSNEMNDRLHGVLYISKASLSFLSLLYSICAEILHITDVTIRHRSGACLGNSPYPKLSA